MGRGEKAAAAGPETREKCVVDEGREGRVGGWRVDLQVGVNSET
jgi:hypothetical protein